MEMYNLIPLPCHLSTENAQIIFILYLIFSKIAEFGGRVLYFPSPHGERSKWTAEKNPVFLVDLHEKHTLYTSITA